MQKWRVINMKISAIDTNQFVLIQCKSDWISVSVAIIKMKIEHLFGNSCVALHENGFHFGE